MSDIIENLNKKNISEDIRPILFEKYIGQKDIKKNLEIAISGVKKRGHQLDHILFYGPPGLGKTTISKIVANELNVNIKVVTGTSIEKAGDIAKILMNLEEGDVLFIDEIHRIPKIAEEAIYSAMEDFQLHLNIENEEAITTIKIDLPKFTLIGATTRAGMLTKPMRDRFGMVFRLKYYNIEELSTIIINASKTLKIKITKDASKGMAERSRYTPRIALKFLKRIRDFADYHKKDKIDIKLMEDSFKALGVFEDGLDEIDLNYLKILNNSNKVLALKTISSKLNETIETIEDSIEPYLIEKNLIEKTARGRQITDLGKKSI